MSGSRRRRRRGWITALVLLTAFAVAVGAVVVALNNLSTGPPLVQRCVATLGDSRHSLDFDQAEHAALFAGIAAERGLPPRAVTIAIATAMQESRMRNIDYGDRDSLGLFQQRPSQGWGTEEQVMDPVYATNAFYDGLVQVSGYEQMEITVAAQAVQRSGFPDAYAQHESMARAFAAALTGQHSTALHCTVTALDPEADAPDVAGNLASQLARDYPSLPLTQVTSDDAEHLILQASAFSADEGTAWAVAHWAVATAPLTGVSDVVVEGWHWQRGSQEWVETDPDGLEHTTGQVLVR